MAPLDELVFGENSLNRQLILLRGVLMRARLQTIIAIIAMLSSPALAQGAAKLTDSEIAHIAYTSGQLEIESAELAISKSTNLTVRTFAETMVHEMTEANRQALDLARKIRVTPTDNDLSRALIEQAANKRAELAKLEGAEFDRAYIANEVAYHLLVNGALEVTLIPSATDGELRSLLQTGLKTFQGHQRLVTEAASALK